MFREEDLTKLKEEIETLWNLKNVPEYQRLVFRDAVFSLTRSRAIPIISKEISCLRKNKSLVQNALKTVRAREDSLKSLIEMDSYLKQSPGWESFKEVKIECAELLHAHRMLTLAAVESIVKWRDQFQFSGVTYDFMLENENYLQKIKADTAFLSSSEFAKIFRFCTDGSDPLILLPSEKSSQKSKKKINNSFFEIDGQITIPLPAMIVNRLKMAEKIVLNDEIAFKVLKRKSFRKKDLLNEEIRDRVIEEYLKEFLPNVVKEGIKEFSSKQSALEEIIYDGLFHQILLSFVKDSLNDIDRNSLKSQRVYTDYIEIGEMFSDCVKENYSKDVSLSYETYTDFARDSNGDELRENTNESTILPITERIYNGLVDEIITKTSKRILKEKKSEMDYISDRIYTDLVEDFLSKFARESFREYDSENTMKTYLSELILTGLFDEDIYTNIIASAKQEYTQELDTVIADQLCDELVEIEVNSECEETSLIDTYVPPIENTPYVESPVSSAPDFLNLEYDIEGDFNDLSGVIFKPLAIDESLLRAVLHDYFQYLPSQLSQCAMPVDALIYETKANNNPSWFWAMRNDKILGLLVFSENSQLLSSYTITVHHLSCINFSAYKKILHKVEEFITDTEKCESLRVDFYTQFSEIDKDIKSMLSKHQFKWKARSLLHDGELMVYGKEMQGRKHQDRMTIESRCEVLTSEEEAKESKKTDKNLIVLGERICILNSLKKLHDTNNEILTLNRLQRDLVDLLDIIEAVEGFNFPNIDSENSLKLSFNWTGFSETSHQPLDICYHYIKFHHNLTYRQCESAEIYTVPTSIPSISAFFIVATDLLLDLRTDFRNLKTDLYYKAESLLRSADFDVKTVDELLVPVFSFNINSHLHWMEGLMVSDKFIQKCSSDLVIQSCSSPEKQGLLPFKPSNIIGQNFIFGIVQEDVYKAIEGPLFACLVQEKDWIKVE